MKFQYNGSIDEFVKNIKINVSKLNSDKLDVFSHPTQMKVTIVDDTCKILLEKDNPANTQYWFIASMLQKDNHVIIEGKIRECIRTKKDKTQIVLLYILLWPILPIIWFFCEWTPFHSIKYRKTRLRELMIHYIGCTEL